MAKTFQDKTGAEVTVDLSDSTRSYQITVDDGTVAGHAYFLPGPDSESERIFSHTVVDEEFGGRGLSTILVAEALADCRERGLTVVPICPLFVRKLQDAGDDYQAEGGRFRNATGADYAIVEENSQT